MENAAYYSGYRAGYFNDRHTGYPAHRPKEWTAADVIPHRSAYPALRKLVLNISHRCQFRCKMCAFRGEEIKPEQVRMSLADWKKLIDDTYQSKAVYTLFGGEPLMYGDCDELLRHMASRKASVNLVTNGYELDAHLNTLKDSNCSIVLSVDGLENTHDSIRGKKGSFQKIRNLLEKIALDGSFPMEKISVNSVLLPENAHEAGELIDFLHNHRVLNLTFQHMQFLGEWERDATNTLWQDYLDRDFAAKLEPRQPYVFSTNDIWNLSEAVKVIWSKAREYPDMSIGVCPDFTEKELPLYYTEQHFQLAKKSLCLDPWTAATVSWDGSIELCLGIKIGNCKDGAFWDAWFGRDAQDFRSFAARTHFAACTRCCKYYNSYTPD